MENVTVSEVVMKFIVEVEKWLSIFYRDLPEGIRSGQDDCYCSKNYTETPLEILEFIDAYKDRFKLRKYSKKEYFCSYITYISFTDKFIQLYHEKNPGCPTLDYDSITTIQWITQWISEDQSLFDIHFTNERWRSKQLVKININREYENFYFGFTSIITYIFKSEIKLDFYTNTKGEDENYDHKWCMEKRVYLQCLDLFPRLTIYVNKNWRKRIRKMLEVYGIIKDISNICLSYLRFSDKNCEPI